MAFNFSSGLWEYATFFTSKGDQLYTVHCNSGEQAQVGDSVFITNSRPYLQTTPDGFIDFDGNGVADILFCVEDQVCFYNFTAAISEDDMNDLLLYSYDADSANTTLSNLTFSNNYTGIISANSILNVANPGGIIFTGNTATTSPGGLF